MNRGVIYVALSAMLYGCIGYYGMSLMNLGFSVSDLLLWRFLASSLLLVPILVLFFREWHAIDIKAVCKLFATSAIFYGGGTACYFEATRSIGTGLAMVLFFTYPLIVALLSVILKKSPLNLSTSISLLLIVLGCTLIAFGEGGGFTMDLHGIAVALLSGFGYGLYIFFTKESCKQMPPLLSATVVCLANVTLFSLYAYLKQGFFFLPDSFVAWKDIILFALIGTVLPIFLLLRGMKFLSANKASIIGVLEPVATLAVGALLLHEEISFWQCLGAATILLSAIVVQLEKEPATAESLSNP